MAGETPSPVFKPVDARSGRGEGFKNPFSKEQRQARAEKKAERIAKKQAERAARRDYTPADMVALREARKNSGTYLNMTEHPSFQDHRKELIAAAKSRTGLQAEVLGNKQGELTPSQFAQIDAQAYEKFKQENPTLIESCRANDLYFTPPDNKGNQRIDYRRDPWMRAVDAQAHEEPSQAPQIYAQFCKECPEKAKVYALLGHKGLAQQIAGMETRGPEATVVATNTNTKTETTQDTSRSPEQKLKTDLAKYDALLKKPETDMTVREKNEMRQLRKDHEQGITKAQDLANAFHEDPNKILTPEELNMLDQYQAFLKTPDVAEQKPATEKGQDTQTASGQEKQNPKEVARQQKQRNAQAYQELTALGIDLSRGREQILQDLAEGKIKNRGGGEWQNIPQTQAYIEGAFAAKAEVDAIMANLPEASGKKFEKKDILEILLFLLASGALSMANEAKQAITQ